jgi:hypothetical protein
MNEMNKSESDELNKVTDTSDIIEVARKLNRVVWITWWAGTALVVLSWVNIVSNKVGWLGFGIGCASSIISSTLSNLKIDI